MRLFDIGNSFIKMYNNGVVHTFTIDRFDVFPKDEKFYYINVNHRIKEKLAYLQNGINLEPFFMPESNYQGMGIDRKAVCAVIDDGLVVDAGSAITIDVMEEGKHLGGCILPGLVAYEKSFATISPALSYKIEKYMDLDTLPNNTQEALSYAVLNSIRLLIKEIAQNKTIYFTGGDGAWIAHYFENAHYNPTLVFDGMKHIIKENRC